MSNLQLLGPHPDSSRNHAKVLDAFTEINRHETMLDKASKLLRSLKISTPAPKVNPCANVQVYQYKSCQEPGIFACSACKLVSYCSQECQHAHWRHHKPDCKHEMRSPVWKPETPSPMEFFANMFDDSDWMSNRFNLCVPLWGNIPSSDIINLSNNEKDEKRDFCIAFAASGDLRHVVTTVNSLPDTYSMKLTILLNDRAPWIVGRNVSLLLILSRIPDLDLAVDVALHFWYSVFTPSEYRLHYVGVLMSLISEVVSKADESCLNINLVGRSKASLLLSPETWDCLRYYATSTMSMEEAQAEYGRVRSAPSRKAHRDAMYLGLRPSHRVAFWQYRSYGIVLPHGATNAHFNQVNPSLFAPTGEWFQTDYADPIEGWDVADIISAGKRYGAHPEDIYGCFYFMVKERLTIFAERLRKFDITFIISAADAATLPKVILSDERAIQGIPSTTRFDRIHVSNIMDKNYVGIEKVLTEWSPLLSENPLATIIGYFMNWFQHIPDDERSPQYRKDLDKAVGILIREGKIPNLRNRPAPTSLGCMIELMASVPTHLLSDVHARMDTSKEFQRYLSHNNFQTTLNKLGLRRREKHLIVPQRILGPLGGTPAALPIFSDPDAWYFNTKLTCYTWTERFIEIVKH